MAVPKNVDSSNDTIASNPSEEGGADDGRFEFLLDKSQKFCEAFGLPRDIVIDIYHSDTDWAFILKIQALLEAAAKEIIEHSINLKLGEREIRNSMLTDFVDSLPMSGRSSLLKLLESAGCPADTRGFLESTRRVRNAYAHNIKNINLSLLDLVLDRKDPSYLLKHLSAIENPDEAKLVSLIKKDHFLLRFGILDETMRFLAFAYYLTLKHRDRG